MFNNETGLFDFWKDDFDSQWFEDDDGFLYIIGGPGRDDLALGPDNETSDRILGTLRASGSNRLSKDEITSLGLLEIPDVLKRFNPLDGFYHA